jgi:hypothetical protein
MNLMTLADPNENIDLLLTLFENQPGLEQPFSEATGGPSFEACLTEGKSPIKADSKNHQPEDSTIKEEPKEEENSNTLFHLPMSDLTNLFIQIENKKLPYEDSIESQEHFKTLPQASPPSEYQPLWDPSQHYASHIINNDVFISTTASPELPQVELIPSPQTIGTHHFAQPQTVQAQSNLNQTLPNQSIKIDNHKFSPTPPIAPTENMGTPITTSSHQETQPAPNIPSPSKNLQISIKPSQWQTTDLKQLGLELKKPWLFEESPILFILNNKNLSNEIPLTELIPWISQSPFFSQALAHEDLAAFFKEPRPLSQQLDLLQIPLKELALLEQKGCPLDAPIPLSQLFKSLDLDPQVAYSSIVELKETLTSQGSTRISPSQDLLTDKIQPHKITSDSNAKVEPTQDISMIDITQKPTVQESQTPLEQNFISSLQRSTNKAPSNMAKKSPIAPLTDAPAPKSQTTTIPQDTPKDSLLDFLGSNPTQNTSDIPVPPHIKVLQEAINQNLSPQGPKAILTFDKKDGTPVSVTVSLEQKKVHIRVLSEDTENDSWLDSFKEELPELEKRLDEHNLTLGSVDFSTEIPKSSDFKEFLPSQDSKPALFSQEKHHSAPDFQKRPEFLEPITTMKPLHSPERFQSTPTQSIYSKTISIRV